MFFQNQCSKLVNTLCKQAQPYIKQFYIVIDLFLNTPLVSVTFFEQVQEWTPIFYFSAWLKSSFIALFQFSRLLASL